MLSYFLLKEYFLQLYPIPRAGSTVRCIDGSCTTREGNSNLQFVDQPKSSSRQNSTYQQPSQNEISEPSKVELSPLWAETQQFKPIEQPLPSKPEVIDTVSAGEAKKSEQAALDTPATKKNIQEVRGENQFKPTPPPTSDLSYLPGLGISIIAIIIFISAFSKAINDRKAGILANYLDANGDIGREGVFYVAPNKIARITQSKSLPHKKIKVKMTQLEFSHRAYAKTTSISLEAILPVGTHDFLTFVDPSRFPPRLPDEILVGDVVWKHLDKDTEYYRLASKHHKYWNELWKATKLRQSLKQQITDIHAKAQKYLANNLFPEAKAKIEEVLSEFSTRLENTDKLIEQLEVLVGNLVISIESIEDFGGVLLGYEAPQEFIEADNREEYTLASSDVEIENDALIQGIDALSSLQKKWKNIDVELSSK